MISFIAPPLELVFGLPALFYKGEHYLSHNVRNSEHSYLIFTLALFLLHLVDVAGHAVVDIGHSVVSIGLVELHLHFQSGGTTLR